MFRVSNIAIATIAFLCTFAIADQSNGKGASSPQEVASTVCAFPNIPLAKEMVVLGASAEGGKKLDFPIEQRSGTNAGQIDVVVNYPGTPVALMIGASNPTIWNISWTEGTKIAAVFVNGYNRQRVAGLKKSTPLLVSTYEDKGACETSAFKNKTFGRDEESFTVFNYGQITKPVEALKEQRLSQALFSRSISGIFPVDAESGSVVIGQPIKPDQDLLTSPSSTPASFHNIREPQVGQAALEQAVENGFLRRANLSDAANWINALRKKYALQNLPPPNIPPDLNNAFVVLQKFAYPSGLYGGNSATFYIPEGIPTPSGDYGHSRVYDLNSISLECKAGSTCGQSISRGEIGSGSVPLQMTIGR